MNDRIDLTGIEVVARHGVLPEEKQEPQVFRIDLTVYTDHHAAAESDSLADTIDYAGLAQQTHDLVAGESHDLIERVAERVAAMTLSDPRISRVVVTVHKPWAPIPLDFEDVSVTVDRSR